MSIVVAIDGPAGAGKSTVARRVASELGLTYLDTGAMYRALALLALWEQTASTDETALAEMARRMDLTLSPLTEEGSQQVWLGGREVTQAIRTPAVSQRTSAISALPEVRRVMVERQRNMADAAPNGVVMEGRDIGAVVFPNADVKIFLTATPEERARRRTDELRAGGMEVDADQVLAEQNERDARDSGRAASPLKPAPDALILTTDGLTIDEVVARIKQAIDTRK